MHGFKFYVELKYAQNIFKTCLMQRKKNCQITQYYYTDKSKTFIIHSSAIYIEQSMYNSTHSIYSFRKKFFLSKAVTFFVLKSTLNKIC